MHEWTKALNAAVRLVKLDNSIIGSIGIALDIKIIIMGHSNPKIAIDRKSFCMADFFHWRKIVITSLVL